MVLGRGSSSVLNPGRGLGRWTEVRIAITRPRPQLVCCGKGAWRTGPGGLREARSLSMQSGDHARGRTHHGKGHPQTPNLSRWLGQCSLISPRHLGQSSCFNQDRRLKQRSLRPERYPQRRPYRSFHSTAGVSAIKPFLLADIGEGQSHPF